TQRLVKGLTYIAAYTWSRSIDMASELEATMAGNNNVRPQDNTNRRADRGVSDFDLTHRFTLSWVYTLPLPRPSSKFLAYLIERWQTSGVLTAQTGNPFSVWTGADRSLTGNNADRPNLVGDPNTGTQSVTQWFNTKAFALNNLGQFGNAGRNLLRGPRYINLDF